MTENLTTEILAERLKSLEQKMCLKLEASEKALSLARETLEARLEGMNELRKQLDQQISRTEFEDKMKVVQDKMTEYAEKSNEQFRIMESRVQGVEYLKAEMSGRLWALTAIMAILFIVYRSFMAN